MGCCGSQCCEATVIKPVPAVSRALAQPLPGEHTVVPADDGTGVTHSPQPDAHPNLQHIRGPSQDHIVPMSRSPTGSLAVPNGGTHGSHAHHHGPDTLALPGASNSPQQTIPGSIPSNSPLIQPGPRAGGGLTVVTEGLGAAPAPQPSPNPLANVSPRHRHPDTVKPGVIDKGTQQLCLMSWKKVLAGSPQPMKDKLAEAKRASASPGGAAGGPLSAAGLFYETYYNNLFAADPVESKSFFSAGGIQRKSRALLRMVSTCLALTGEKKERITLTETAREHAIQYGVSPDSYVHTMDALLKSLSELLGANDGWTPEVRHAWEQTREYVLYYMLPMARQHHRPVVVVVGGGYAGVQLAKKLDLSGKFRVVVLERKRYFFHNIGSLRAALDPENWADAMMVPYRNLLKNGVFLHGDVAQLRKDGVAMYGRGDDPRHAAARRATMPPGGAAALPPPPAGQLDFDESALIRFKYMVVATGSSYNFPAKVGQIERKELIATYKLSAEACQKANNIVIVGGGAVGAELAGEIAEMYGKTKKCTIVHRRPHLCFSHGSEPLARDAEAKLRDMGVTILLNEEASLDDDTKTAHATMRQHMLVGARTVTTSKGTKIDCDLLFICSGTRINSGSYRNAPDFAPHVGEFDRLKVNEYFQVGPYHNVFAIGDCALTGDPLMTVYAMRQASACADNIIAHEEGRAMSAYVRDPKLTLVLSLGAKRGVGVWQGKELDEPNVVRMKSSDFNATNTWNQLGFDFKTHRTVDWGDGMGSIRNTGGANDQTKSYEHSTTHSVSASTPSESARRQDDVKTLATTMHITEAEAQALLEDGLKVKPRVANETFT